LVKVEFSPEDPISLGCFLVIEDVKTPYVAQVLNIREDAEQTSAVSKLLFTFDEEGVLKNYNGTIPALSAEVTILGTKELLDILPVDDPIKLGEVAQQNTIMSIDKSVFENNFLICANNQENIEIFFDNILRQFERTSTRSVIFDLDGHFQSENKAVFLRDFKLPLNYDTINFVYENDLNDIDPTSKAIIQDIFIEVQEYTKTIEGGFIPFDTFLSVVDGQYRETQIPQLILLKNKLLKYKEAGVFAQTPQEANSFNKVLELGTNVIVDLSSTSRIELKEQILDMAYSILNNMDVPTYVFVELDDEYAHKPLLKLLTTNGNAYTTIICPHEFKYIKELKSISRNIVFFAPLTLQHDFAAYNTILNKLNADEFIIIGDLTQQIPFVLQLETLNLDEETEESEASEEAEFSDEISPEDFDAEEIDNEPLEDDEIDNAAAPETSDDTEYEEVDPSDVIIDEDVDAINAEPLEPEEELPQEDSQQETEDVNVEPIEEPISEDSIEEPEIDLGLEDEVDNDVNEATLDDISTEQSDDFTEEPLDDSVLDDLASDGQDDDSVLDELSGESNDDLELIESEETPPVIPVYAADEINVKQPVEFNEGDKVIHPTYGKGTVEKLINYGNKKLCSVMFENKNRRLLDPVISSLKKRS
jgi:hypothetical protein